MLKPGDFGGDQYGLFGQLQAPALDAGISPFMPQQDVPPTPFVWGAGGSRMTPEQVADERARAQQLSAAGMDFSPAQSWTQGLARVADGLVGGLENRRARKADEANTAESQSVVQALMNANDPKTAQSTVLSALANPYIDQKTRALVGAEYSKLNPPAREPHFFEANNGDQGAIDPATGQVSIMYHDPTPKVNWVTSDNGDGTKTLVPVVNGQVMQGGGGPVSGAQAGQAAPPTAAIAELRQNPSSASQFDEIFGAGASARILGGPTPSASGGFPHG